jgi:hypothetical protein
MTLEAVHAGIVVTVRGRPVTVKMVICSGPERQELRQPGEHRLREFIAKSGLHQAGDGEMFVCFVEQAAGTGTPDLGRAEPIAIVHERDDGSPVLHWSAEEALAACRDVLAQIAARVESTRGRPAPGPLPRRPG